MKLRSKLPVGAVYFKHWHTDDREVGIVVAKAEFGRREDGRFRANQPGPELRMADEMGEGEEGYQPVLYEQDIAPGKIGTDLIVRGVARSPDAEPMTDWPVSIEVPGKLSYQFHVRGPCEWRRGTFGWGLSTPELVQEVPITYALAYGGTAPGEDDEDPPVVSQVNPAGMGLTSPGRLKRKDPFPAPQIGLLADFMAADPRAEMMVAGSMPIAKGWLPRRGFAGTFDAYWERHRHPRMPKDYSLKYWNCAPGPLQADPNLVGDEEIVLTGFSHAEEPLRIGLPRVGLVLRLMAEDGGEGHQEMVLDTVDIDVTDPDPMNHVMHLTWRTRVDRPLDWVSGSLDGIRLGQAPAPQAEEAEG